MNLLKQMSQLLLNVWRHPMFRFVLGIYTLAPAFLVALLATEDFFTQLFGLSTVGVLLYFCTVMLPGAFLVAWAICKFMFNAEK